MRTFQVFRHPRIGNTAVKAGFCWPALFFGVFWMLGSRLWARAGTWIGLCVALIFLAEGVQLGQDATLTLLLVCYLVLWIVPGFQGNAWRAKNLLGRNFLLVAKVQAKSKRAAIASASKSMQEGNTASVEEKPASLRADATSIDIRKLSNLRFFWWFALVNAGIVLTLTLVTQGAGLGVGFIIAAIGSAGSIFSLLFSRWLAIKAHSIVVVNDKTNHDLSWLVDTVEKLSKKAGLRFSPQLGVWPGPEVNAFATGPGHKRALIAVSTPLLETLPREEITAVAAHEIAHIANRDMLAMTLLQGVVNTIVLTAILPVQAFRVFNFLSDKFSWFSEFAALFVKFCITILLTFIGSLFVKAFSRHREYRADAVAAKLVGAEHMKSALQRLSGVPAKDQRIAQAQDAFAAFKISGGGLIELLSTHPRVEKRIQALDLQSAVT